MSTTRFKFIIDNPALFAPAFAALVSVTFPPLITLMGNILAFTQSNEKEEAFIHINNIKALMLDGNTLLSHNNPDYHAALRVFQNAKLLIDQFNQKYRKIMGQEHLIPFNEHILKLYNNIADTFFRMHRYPDALEMIQTILTIDNNYREALNLKGMINLRLYLFNDKASEEKKLNYLTESQAAFNASINIDQNQHDIYACQLFVTSEVAKETSKLNLECIVETVDNIVDDENKIVSPWATELMVINALTYHRLKDFENSTIFYDYALNWTSNTPAFYLDKANLFSWAAKANLDLENNYRTVTEPDIESKGEAQAAPSEKPPAKLSPEEKHTQYNAEAKKLREKANLYLESVKPVTTPPVQPITSQNRYRDWLPSKRNMLIGGGTLLTGLAACVAFKPKLSNKP